MDSYTENKILTVAVVDDDPSVRILLKEILAGYNVLMAESYGQLKELLAANRPHLLFLDVNLSDANGIDICSNIREKFDLDDMVIFLVTALPDEDTIRRGYASGADDFIRKPFHHFEIKAKTAIFERIIQSTSDLNSANAKLEEKNRKFYSFGRLIQKSLGIRKRDESLATAGPLQQIVNADFCEVTLLKPDGPECIYSRSVSAVPSPLDFSELAGKIDLKKSQRTYFASVRKGGAAFNIAMVKVKQMNTIYGYVMFQKKAPFNEDDREIITMYGDFLNILSERGEAEEELHQKNREFKEEINKIRTIQVSLMPKFKEITRFDIASSYLPAKELSGDFIDAFFISDDIYQIILCDVSGHGIAASYVGNEFRTLFRTLSKPDRNPAKIVNMVNEAAVRDLNDLYYFCTVAICQIRLSIGEISYTIAGHPSPILITNGGVRKISQTGPLVGLFSGMEYRDEKLNLAQGDCLFLYTDGITEASNVRSPESNEMFGEERLCDLVAENCGYASTDILHFVISSVYEYTDYQDQVDDITAVCIKGK